MDRVSHRFSPRTVTDFKGLDVRAPEARPATLLSTVGVSPGPISPESRPISMPGGLLERFEVLGELGSGGMGVVHLARDRRLGRQVAIKLIRDQSEDMVRRFEQEARLMASLEHDNLVRLYEFGVDSGVPYVVMEYVRGTPLSGRLSTGRPTLVESVRITLDVLRGIGEAHAQGIVHRDLKPGNVILDSSGRAKVADFGLGLRVDDALSADASPRGERLTSPGLLLGTPGYVAPEVISGEEAKPAADIYAVGVMLHEMLTGHRLFSGRNVIAVFDAQRRDEVAPPSATNPIVPPVLDGLVAQALRIQPDARIGGPELIVALELWLQQGTRSTRTPAAAGLPPRPYKLLEKYTREDAAIFFGREAESAELLELVDNPRCRVLSIFGSCGIGKSSLIAAGLVARLDPASHATVVLTAGDEPARAIEEALVALARKHGVRPGGEEPRVASLERRPQLLIDLLTAVLAALGKTLVLVVDQLEEVFTRNAHDARPAGRLFDIIGRMAEVPGLPLRIVLSYRTEFRGDCFPLEERLGPAQLSFHVRDLRPGALVEAIEGPTLFDAYRFHYEKDLPARISADIVETTQRCGDAALPLLQIICSQLHEQMKARGAAIIGAELYESGVGGASGALRRYLEERLASPAYAQRGGLARQILTALTTKEAGGERYARPREEEELLAFPDSTGASDTLERLIADHLVVREIDPRGRTVHLASEVMCPLIETWAVEPDDTERAARMLGWAYRHWRDSGQSPENLLSGGLLQFVVDRLPNLANVGPKEKHYLEGAVRRRERRFSMLFVVMVGLIASLVGSTLTGVSLAVIDQSDSRESAALEATRRVVQSFERLDREALVRISRLLASNPRFMASVADYDAATVEEEARDFLDDTKADLFAVTGDNADVLCARTRSGPVKLKLSELASSWPRSREATSGVLVKDGVIYRTVSVQIPIALKRCFLTTGFAMNDSFAQRVKEASASDFAVALDGEVRLSTIPALTRVAAAPGGPAARVVIGDHPYLQIVDDFHGHPAAGSAPVHVILRDLAPGVGFVSRLQRLMFLLGAGAVGLALLLSYGLTRRFSRWL